MTCDYLNGHFAYSYMKRAREYQHFPREHCHKLAINHPDTPNTGWQSIFRYAQETSPHDIAGSSLVFQPIPQKEAHIAP